MSQLEGTKLHERERVHLGAYVDRNLADQLAYIDLERFRHREWAPALRAAGLAPRGPHAMRHSFATWAIESDEVSSRRPRVSPRGVSALNLRR
jgi:integrase